MTAQSATKAILFLATLPTQTLSQDDRILIATPTPPTDPAIPPAHILVEEYTNQLPWDATPIVITSNVPVTIQRYDDFNSGYSFLSGQEPLYGSETKVLVTSSCSTSETNVIPTVEFKEDTSGMGWEGMISGISVTVSDPPDPNAGGGSAGTPVDGSWMSWLTPSFYQAFWSYASWSCYEFQTPPTVSIPEPGGTGATESMVTKPATTGGATKPATTAGATTPPEGTGLPTGVIDDGLPFIPTTPSGSGIVESTVMPGGASTLWPPGDALSDYSSCNFDCCTNADCPSIPEATDSVVEQCCTDGTCQPKQSWMDQTPGVCPDVVGPPADLLCGYDAWLAWQTDGLCPDSKGSSSSSTSSTISTVSRGTTLSASGSSTVPLSVNDDTSTSATTGMPDPSSTTTSTVAATTSITSTSTTTTTTTTTTFTTTTTMREESNPPSGGSTTSPTNKGTLAPTPLPTPYPTPEPTPEPTFKPTPDPTPEPTEMEYFPTLKPIEGSDPSPMEAVPEPNPTTSPVQSPKLPTSSPARSPTVSPNGSPTSSPVKTVSKSPSDSPIGAPLVTDSPNSSPTASPETSSGLTPSSDPTGSPTFVLNATNITNNPTTSPSADSSTPTERPSRNYNDVFGVNEWPDEPLTSRNSGYRVSARMIMSSFIVILIVSLILPGRGPNEGAYTGYGANGLFGIGKFAVAAGVVASLYHRSANVRSSSKSMQNANSPPFSRSLQTPMQTCIYNVEVLITGCDHPLQITAPATRIVNVVIEDMKNQPKADDKCVTEYSANLTFPLTVRDVEGVNNGEPIDNYKELETPPEGSIEVDALPFENCMKIIEGRPFVDKSGGIVQAEALISLGSAVTVGDFSWTGGVVADGKNNCDSSWDVSSCNMTQSNQNTNGEKDTHHYQLGEEWTNRALGEHSSVASFSAFSIALMTNGAPSKLVEDALLAGLDEIRHARVSFEIASKLIGSDLGMVGPGPLPSTNHEFKRNLTELGLAVAKEGCVDETLSAFAAAVEVEEIEFVLGSFENESKLEVSSRYSTLDKSNLVWIRDELRTIALEESSHSALAWRTLKWICRMDSEACNAIQSEVFQVEKLDMAFYRRFDVSMNERTGRNNMLELIRTEWDVICEVHKVFKPDDCARDCETYHALESGFSVNSNLASEMRKKIMQGVHCD